MAQHNKICKKCGEKGHSGFYCRNTPRKPIAKKGKQTIRWETFRDQVARPYLDKKYGRICAACKGERCGNKNLDVDHIKGRGSHHELMYDLSNLQYLGRYPCHIEKTDGKVKE